MQAMQDFRQAMLYPVNLGTGRPPSPDMSEQQYWIGNAFQAQQNVTAAKSAWKMAARGETVFSAIADRKLGHSTEAKRIFQAKIHAAIEPDASAEDSLAAARAEEFNGDTAAARRYFKKALDLDPSLWRARIEMEQLNRTGR
ncbi:MAG: hypothetical protein ACRD4Q_15660 [Candidatus Acidiferrales bacterium]